VSGFVYDRGDHRYKHCWNQDRADFVAEGNAVIGKCPNGIDDAVAQRILDRALPEPDPFLSQEGTSTRSPSRLYGVHLGIVYEAVPTTPGRSFHGYPWRRRPGRARLPSDLVAQLRRQAEESGHERQFDRWMKEHG
jgi:hypothetical protein